MLAIFARIKPIRWGKPIFCYGYWTQRRWSYGAPSRGTALAQGAHRSRRQQPFHDARMGPRYAANASWCSVTARPIVSCRYSDSLDPAPQLKIHHSRNANASGPCKPHLRHFQQGARGTALFQRDFHDAALENAGSPQKGGHRAHDAMVRACAGWRRI
jgi:hypothetical protein